MRALVTGGAARLGRAISTALARAGFDLAIHHHGSTRAAAELAREIESTGRRVLLPRADLSTVSGCRRLAAELRSAWGSLDVLVNSAAVYEPGEIGEIDPADWDRVQATNCRAPFLLVQGLLPALRASTMPGGAAVINIADIAGERPQPGHLHYSVSKAALLMLTRALALELAPGVRVNAILPGTVLPPSGLEPERRRAIVSTIPLGREGSPRDVASIAVFLATSAPYVTGQAWAADGGRSVAGPLEAG